MPTCHSCHGGRYLASTDKRLGEDCSFSGAFVVFCDISAIFRALCFVEKRNFVYLQAVKGVAPISDPEYNKLKKLRVTLNLK